MLIKFLSLKKKSKTYKIDKDKTKEFLKRKSLVNKSKDKHRLTNKIFIVDSFNNNSLYSQKGSNGDLYSNSMKTNSKFSNPNQSISRKTSNFNSNNNIDINMEEYIITEYDDMVFEEAIRRDKRKFCVYFKDKIKSNLIIINTFFVSEPFKPRPIKLILFILDIDLYLFVNALFINEEFISEIFHSNKKENFFSFIPRSLDRCFYTTLVSAIVNYLIEFFFIEEKKIKRIFKREKNSITILRYEISQVIKDMVSRFKFFIIISFIITIFTLYHISCFNGIYPHMKYEWIKSSIFIIIIMQILSVLIIFIESIARFISFRFKSEKCYKISLFLS